MTVVGGFSGLVVFILLLGVTYYRSGHLTPYESQVHMIGRVALALVFRRLVPLDGAHLQLKYFSADNATPLFRALTNAGLTLGIYHACQLREFHARTRRWIFLRRLT